MKTAYIALFFATVMALPRPQDTEVPAGLVDAVVDDVLAAVGDVVSAVPDVNADVEVENPVAAEVDLDVDPANADVDLDVDAPIIPTLGDDEDEDDDEVASTPSVPESLPTPTPEVTAP
ncbi:hypothetical protein BDY21DRAFT_363600 [Lineolata rhizophorae]|uniref:Uncharacterized protein n=1 Tax=Lineolata rhizophorae TaxID=578093 RepID=A0A6A6P2H3_9PEZI|nr:hypothetical protein BDY21DRAFT_363600 [Lineolata rhizophorae]